MPTRRTVPDARYADEASVLQEVADMLCDRVGTERVTVVVHGNMKRVYGQALLQSGIMRISALIANDIDEVDNTIRHEVAHFMAWRLFGHAKHGAAWKHCCSITGARPETYHASITDFEDAKFAYRYAYTCPDGCIWYSYRPRKRFLAPGVTCAKHHWRLTQNRIADKVSSHTNAR